MAHIRRITTPKGSISYQARWSEYDATGKRVQRTRCFDTHAAAKAHITFAAEAERRGIADPRQHSVQQYLLGWLRRLEDRGELSPSTIAGYRRHVEKALPLIGHLPLSGLTGRHLDDLYTYLLKRGGRAKGQAGDRSIVKGLSSRSTLHIHRVLHAAFEKARKWKLIGDNPARDATAPSPGRSPARAFTPDQVGKLLRAAEGDGELFAMVATLLVTGVRRSELLGLAFSDIDFAGKTATINRTVLEVRHEIIVREKTKTEHSRRTIPIPDELLALLKDQRDRVLRTAARWRDEYAKEPLLVFPGIAGAPMLPQRCTDRLTFLLGRAGIEGVQPVHGWRHTAATSLYHATRNAKIVQAHLGHASMAFTMETYVKPLSEDRTAADHFSNVLRIGREKP